MGRVMPIPPSKGRVMGRVMGYCGGVVGTPVWGGRRYGVALYAPRGRVLSRSCNACPTHTHTTTHKRSASPRYKRPLTPPIWVREQRFLIGRYTLCMHMRGQPQIGVRRVRSI